jgi:5-formyltetrahydrofolate cyclo-ligase
MVAARRSTLSLPTAARLGCGYVFARDGQKRMLVALAESRMTNPKIALRTETRERRSRLAAALPGFTAALAAQADALPLKPGSIVGGYHALPQEADPALLLQALAERGHTIAYPRVTIRGARLDYHRVPEGEALRTGAWGIQEPAAHFPVAEPDFLLVPLLAFDAKGHRLGYGGGFYDRTIAALQVPAIGVAFSGQEVVSLPVEPHDIALNGILTEQGLKLFS